MNEKKAEVGKAVTEAREAREEQQTLKSQQASALAVPDKTQELNELLVKQETLQEELKSVIGEKTGL